MKMFLYRQINHVVILVVLISLLKSCSSTRLIYSFVEEFIKDEVTYFFDLDKEAEVLLNQQVTEMVNWHRISMLPTYAYYLNDMANKLEEGKYSSDDITKILVDGRTLLKETVTGLTPYASKFLFKHQTVEEIEFMEKKMLKRRKERLIELSKPEKVLYEKRLERLISNLERFFGDLTDAQVMFVEEYARVTLGDKMIRLLIRKQRQKVFLAFLKTQPTETSLTDYLNKLLLSNYAITNPAHQTFSETSLDRFQLLLENILAISSITQRETIIIKLREYANDLKAISE